MPESCFLFDLIERSGQRLLDAPPSIQSISQGLPRKADFNRPFHGRHYSTVVREQPIATHVADLLRFRRPTAITWFVASVIVDAVQRIKRRWARTHICVETFELIPFIADTNTSSTVAVVSAGAWVRASLAHAHPGLVFRALGAMCRVAVSGATCLRRAASVAPTGDRVSLLQRRGRYGCRDTAIAATHPACAA